MAILLKYWTSALCILSVTKHLKLGLTVTPNAVRLARKYSEGRFATKYIFHIKIKIPKTDSLGIKLYLHLHQNRIENEPVP